MGLFDVFKSEPPKLTVRLALPAGLLYMMASDGEIEAEEIGQLQSVVGGDKELVNTAIKYLRSVKYEQFLVDAAEILIAVPGGDDVTPATASAPRRRPNAAPGGSGAPRRRG